MLPKKERFNTTDFSLIKKLKSKKIVTKYGFFVVYEGNKKAIVMSKKNFKTAVLRNKLKRLFYNTVKELDVLKNLSFAFYPRKVFTKEELFSDLIKLI